MRCGINLESKILDARAFIIWVIMQPDSPLRILGLPILEV